MDDERIIKCPKCGKTVRVEIEDVMDISVEDGNHMTRWCVGHCPKCKARFQWDAVFQFSHVKNVEFDGTFADEE